MSIHEDSEECCVSNLELFDVPPTQTAVEKCYDVEFLPMSALRDSGVVEFYVPASAEDYIDLKNSKLYIKAKIVLNDNTDCGNRVVTPVNNLLQSMWSNVELLINDRLITHSNNVHGYVSMLSHLIHDSQESLESERQMQFLYKDTAGQMDTTESRYPNPTNLIPGYSWRPRIVAGDDNPLPVELVAGDVIVGNRGLHERWKHCRESREFELLGPERLDLFEQLRCLPNGINLKLRLHPQKKAFTLMSDGADQFKIQLLSASFIVRKLKPTPGVLLGHADALKLKPASYPLIRKECKSFAIPQGLAQFKQDNIFLGQLPSRIVIAMVDADAFAGTYAKNPFNFKHYNVNLVQLYADGEPVRSRAFYPDMENSCFVECYNSLFRDKLDGDTGSIIKFEGWSRGYSLFSFKLNADVDCNDHTSLIKHGNLCVEVQFATALAEPFQLLVYAAFDNILKIDDDRQILIDYV